MKRKEVLAVAAALLFPVLLVPSLSLAALPAAFDWRDVEGRNFVTPPKNIGNCGSTWLFGPVAAMESKIMIQNDDPTLQPDLSEMQIMSCGPDDSPCTGGYVHDAFDYIVSAGLTTEACYPYNYLAAMDCSGLCASPTYSFMDTYTFVTSQTEAQVKTLIYNEGPVVIHFNTYEDFYTYSSGIYQHVTGSYVGLKTVVLIGWGSQTGTDYWIAKNDWGTSWWGEGGFFRVAIGDPSVDLTYVYAAGNIDYDGDGALAIDECDDTDPADTAAGYTFYADTDADGYGNAAADTIACAAPTGYVTDNTDCDDRDMAVNSTASEVCDDGIDNDCDGNIDTADSDCSTSSGKGGGGGCGVIDTGTGSESWNSAAQMIVTAFGLFWLWRRTRRISGRLMGSKHEL